MKKATSQSAFAVVIIILASITLVSLFSGAGLPVYGAAKAAVASFLGFFIIGGVIAIVDDLT